MRVDQAAKLSCFNFPSHKPLLCASGQPHTQVDDLVELKKEGHWLARHEHEPTLFISNVNYWGRSTGRDPSMGRWRLIECDERMVTESSSTEILVIKRRLTRTSSVNLRKFCFLWVGGSAQDRFT